MAGKKFTNLLPANKLGGDELLAVSQEINDEWESRSISLDKLVEMLPPGMLPEVESIFNEKSISISEYANLVDKALSDEKPSKAITNDYKIIGRSRNASITVMPTPSGRYVWISGPATSNSGATLDRINTVYVPDDVSKFSANLMAVSTLSSEELNEYEQAALSGEKDNLLKKEGDGFKVLASHPIIPKIYSSSYSTSKSAMARQSMPDGAVVYRGTLSIKNPLGISRLNNVDIFSSFTPQSGYFYLGKDNEFVTVQAHTMPKTTTASTITVDLALVFSGEPFRAFDVYSGEEAVSTEEGDARISVSIRLIAGTTMGQNGFD